MLRSTFANNGMVVAPHHLAAETGRDVLRDGGNAIEAVVAAAATIAVVYPHMNSIGGDGFWLIRPPNQTPLGIDACGASAKLATSKYYKSKGYKKIPTRGPDAALTMAGTVSGWQSALSLSEKHGGRLPLKRLLNDAILYAKKGMAVTEGQKRNTDEKYNELIKIPGFGDHFLIEGRQPEVGEVFRQEKLAATIEYLSDAGLDDFYKGDIAKSISEDLASIGSPIKLEDFTNHQSTLKNPLSLKIKGGTLFNLPPPTQGLASLLILGAFEKLSCSSAESFEFVHYLVETTKQAFSIRDLHITDPSYMQANPETFLQDSIISSLATAVDKRVARNWKREEETGDTVWLGAIDKDGMAVSFIQSIYWEFGSGVVLPHTGITWQNRGASFSLVKNSRNELKVGRKPFHTLNPAMASFDDGSVFSYGTMGGEGQPQTQAAIFARHIWFGQNLQQAISAPRWLLGRTWGEDSSNLKVESRFSKELIDSLIEAGHDVVQVDPYSDLMGHAGGLILKPGGLIEAGADPRSDGRACGY